MKILIVCTPTISHARSIASIAKRLRAKGHEIKWASNQAIEYVTKDCGDLISVISDELRQDKLDFPVDPSIDINDWMLEEWFIPIAQEALIPTLKFARDFKPDLLLTDTTSFWGPMVAEKLRIKWATFNPSIFLQSDERQNMIRDAYNPLEPINWTMMGKPQNPYWKEERKLNALRRSIGLIANLNLSHLSPELILCFSSLDIEMNGVGLPPQTICLGSVFGQSDDVDPFDTNGAEIPEGTSPLIYVTLGINFVGKTELAQQVINAVADLDVRVVVAPVRGELTLPENRKAEILLLQQPISQKELLKDAHLTICTGGFNTVLESLCFGVPVISMPIIKDQRVLANRISELGLGVFLNKTISIDELKERVIEILQDIALKEKVEHFSFNEKLSNTINRGVRIIESFGKNTLEMTKERVLEILPENPVFVPRFKPFLTKEKLVIKSYSETITLKEDVVREAVIWLWNRKEKEESLEELTNNWQGEADLPLIIASLTQKGIMQDNTGKDRISPSEKEQYKSQISVFSHANAGEGITHKMQRGSQYQKRLFNATITVVGNGIFASNLIRNLTQIGVRSFNLVTTGKVENEIVDQGGWFTKNQIGKNTSEALKTQITSICEAANVNNFEIKDSSIPGDSLEDCDLLLLATDEYDPNLYATVDDFCHKQEVQWTSIRQLGWNIEIGPTIVPFNTACYKCFELRRKGGLPSQSTIDGDMINLQTGWFHIALGPEWLTMEALKMLTGFGEVSSLAQLIEFNVPTIEVKKHKVLRLPNCPRCRDNINNPSVSVNSQLPKRTN